MTKHTEQGQRLINTNIERIISRNPGMTVEQAYESYRAEMRRRGSKGGSNSTSRPFRDKPGLAKKAINIRHGNV